jgi:hypothetical protein
MNNATALRSNATVSIPRAGRVPADSNALNSIVALGFCPVKSAERRARVDYLATLISETLMAADFIG